jgi:RNA polymerase sigma factor (sigma-70 family)
MNERPDDDASCIARALAGDDGAARELVDRHLPLVLRIVRGRLPRREAEEDLAQEVFMKVFAALQSYEGAVPFKHWISRIAVNTCLNRIRAEKVRPELRWADLDEKQVAVVEKAAAATDEALDGRAASEVVRRLLESLPAADRLLLEMLELEELSVAEVAARTGWNTTYVRVRAFRARHLLNRRFGKLWKEGRL